MGNYIVTTCGKKFYIDEQASQEFWDFINNPEDYLFDAIEIEQGDKTIVVPMKQISYFVEEAEDIYTDVEDFNE